MIILWTYWKSLVDFLLVLIELFSVGVGWKSAISFERGPYDQKFQVELVPHQPFFFSEN